MKNNPKQLKSLYSILTVIVAILLILIGWFVYLLVKPADKVVTEDNKTTVTTTKNVNQKKKNKNKNTIVVPADESVTKNENTNETLTDEKKDVTTDETVITDKEEGLVEPENEAEKTTTTGEDEADNKNEVTLYFPKDVNSCGTVYPVKREITPSDDPYGQIILEDMHGPKADEGDYTNAIPAGTYLRQVQYTADGPVITVSEQYDTLSECTRKTADAQLIKTANAMFELSEDTAGTVEVGTVD